MNGSVAFSEQARNDQRAVLVPESRVSPKHRSSRSTFRPGAKRMEGRRGQGWIQIAMCNCQCTSRSGGESPSPPQDLTVEDSNFTLRSQSRQRLRRKSAHRSRTIFRGESIEAGLRRRSPKRLTARFEFQLRHTSAGMEAEALHGFDRRATKKHQMSRALDEGHQIPMRRGIDRYHLKQGLTVYQ
jgi:hypothetical protein